MGTAFDEFDVERYVKDDRVHSAIFTDPAIFDLEMERIFHRTWVYVGHESEIPNIGDFKTATVGRMPVIIVRHHDGVVRALLNRCRHRGANICDVPNGNTKYFRCWYHGWTYDTSGRLVSVPGIEAYKEKESIEEKKLLEAEIDSYRGFLYVRLAAGVPDLQTYLGGARRYIDVLVDYSPTGRVAIRPDVVHKTRYRANWKQVGMDGYHVYAVHRSVVQLFAARKDSAGSAVGALQIEDPWSDTSSSRTVGLAYGHSALDLSEQRRAHSAEFRKSIAASPGGKQYLQAMEEAHGVERAEQLISLHGDPHLGIFPNQQLIHDHVRVIIPMAVDETVVHMYPVFIEKVPPEFNAARLRHHEDFYGPAGFGSPDDFELFERTQAGFAATCNPWIDLSRGIGRQRRHSDGSIVGRISDEVTQRSQMKEWKRLMAGLSQ